MGPHIKFWPWNGQPCKALDALRAAGMTMNFTRPRNETGEGHFDRNDFGDLHGFLDQIVTFHGGSAPLGEALQREGMSFRVVEYHPDKGAPYMAVWEAPMAEPLFLVTKTLGATQLIKWNLQGLSDADIGAAVREHFCS